MFVANYIPFMDNLNYIKKHKGRQDLPGEHMWGDLGQILLFLFFFVIWIIDSFVIGYSTFLSDRISWIIRIPVAIVILFFSSYLARSGLKIVFGNEREAPVIIREGVFNIVRHPIYLGAILLYLGMIILTLSILATAFWIIIVLFYYFISRYEEKILLNQFGDDYQQYMDDVPMFFPVLFRKRKK
ncbi:MAG: isoprenylcysteine carboxylmethyltransferase family protein [Bacteroidales bacterium]|nr:MAG: isoprenylcysteine carboxylmethyltransferase family protein [Bacteroidales bacterium]